MHAFARSLWTGDALGGGDGAALAKGLYNLTIRFQEEGFTRCSLGLRTNSYPGVDDQTPEFTCGPKRIIVSGRTETDGQGTYSLAEVCRQKSELYLRRWAVRLCFRFPNILKLVNFHRPIGKFHDYFEFSPDSLDKSLERAYVHIRTAFHFRDGCLVNAEDAGKKRLRHLLGFPQFGEGHLGAVFCG